MQHKYVARGFNKGSFYAPKSNNAVTIRYYSAHHLGCPSHRTNNCASPTVWQLSRSSSRNTIISSINYKLNYDKHRRLSLHTKARAKAQVEIYARRYGILLAFQRQLHSTLKFLFASAKIIEFSAQNVFATYFVISRYFDVNKRITQHPRPQTKKGKGNTNCSTTVTDGRFSLEMDLWLIHGN